MYFLQIFKEKHGVFSAISLSSREDVPSDLVCARNLMLLIAKVDHHSVILVLDGHHQALFSKLQIQVVFEVFLGGSLQKFRERIFCAKLVI